MGEHTNPDWTAIDTPILGHFAENDGMFGPEAAQELESRLKDLGKTVDFVIHPGVDHAFFNDTRPEVYDAEASAQAWNQTVAFLHSELG